MWNLVSTLPSKETRPQKGVRSCLSWGEDPPRDGVAPLALPAQVYNTRAHQELLNACCVLEIGLLYLDDDHARAAATTLSRRSSRSLGRSNRAQLPAGSVPLLMSLSFSRRTESERLERPCLFNGKHTWRNRGGILRYPHAAD